MSTELQDNYSTWEISLIEDKGKDPELRAERDRGSAPVNNVYSSSFVSVNKNSSLDEVIDWYDGHNNEPEYLIEMITFNPVGLGLLFTKVAISFGGGLWLYQEDESGKMKRVKKEDWPKEFKNFYEFNGLFDCSYNSMLDFEIVGNFFSQLVFSKGSQAINQPKKVVRLNRVDPVTVRAIKPGKKSKGEIKEYVLADSWKDVRELRGFQRVKRFNRQDFHDPLTLDFLPGQAKCPSVMVHGKRELAGFPVYGLPQYYGAKKAGELMGEIPHFHINNLLNMFGVRIRVSVNREYINRMMQKTNPDTKKNYTELEIKEHVRKIFHDYATNPENVGKPLLDGFKYDHTGKNPQKDFIIESIKVEFKDDAYKEISEMMSSYFTSGFGIDPALADVITTKGMSSGSEKTQAWNIANNKAFYQRMKVLEVINFIHEFNQWPGQFYWGFENPYLVTKDIDKSGQTESTLPNNQV